MKSVGFIGCGNMAQPIIRSVAEKNVFDKKDIYVYDINEEKLTLFTEENNVNKAKSEEEIVKNCDMVILATKPQAFPELLPRLKAAFPGKPPLFVSIAAGKTTEYIASLLGGGVGVARIFPNLNAEVGEAVSAYTGNRLVSREELARVGEICAAYGEAMELSEELFSAFGVLGGCVPAYAFMFIGALAKAGESRGLDPETAKNTAIQAVLGSAKLLKEKGGNIEDWVGKVCSPGGTTIEGVTSLREADLDGIVKTAFDKSYNKDILLSGN